MLGRNGAGKSTLMRLLAGQALSSAGRRVEAADLHVGYFAQHQLEQLDDAMSPIEHLARFGGEQMRAAAEQELRSIIWVGSDSAVIGCSSHLRPSPVASARGWSSRRSWLHGRTCCSWTSPPITWISR